MAKGGLIVSGSEMSLNRYIEGDAEHTGDKEDLYEVAAQSLERNLGSYTAENAPVIFGLMDTFLKGFSFKDGKLDIGRNLIKNPLTVLLYGSGKAGIASKLASAIKDELHSMMSEIAESNKPWHQHPKFIENPDLVDTLKAVFGNQIISLLENPIKSKIEGPLEKALSGQIDETIGEALVEAIDEATGGLREAMELVRTATQIQGIAFEDAYDKAIERIRTEKGLKKSQLSEKDYETAFVEASQVAPIYNNGAQEFHIVASEKYSSENQISSSLRERLSSGATIPKPGAVGVKGQPYLVIGTGDGRMIINILEAGDADMDRTLMVFDGVEIALDNVFSASRQINQAVWKGWQEESVTTLVHDGYQNFLRQFKPDELGEKGKEALNKLAKSNKTGVDNLISGVGSQLQAKSAQNLARKKALSKVQAYIDHMAGAEAPHVNEGEVVESSVPFDPEMIAEKLNQFYQEALEEAREGIRTERRAAAIQAPNAKLMNQLKKIGEQVEGAEAVKLTGSQLTQDVFKARNDASSEQNSVFWKLLSEQDSLADYTFYVGEQADLEDIRSELGINSSVSIKAGAMYPKNKVVFIANASPETLLHEALHTQTARTLVDHYADPENSADYVADAIGRLENLKDFFMNMSFTKDTAEDRAANLLKEQLTEKANDPAAAMSEFISWTLSNQKLIKIGQDTKVYSPLQNVGRKVLVLLGRLLGIKTRPGKTLFEKVRFNSEIIIKSQDKGSNNLDVLKQEAETQAVFEQAYGEDTNLDRLESKFQRRIQAALEAAVRRVDDPMSTESDSSVVKRAGNLTAMAEKAAEQVESFGFAMNQREKSVFMSIHTGMMTDFESNPAAQRKAYELYSHMLKNAKPGSLSVLAGKGGLRRTSEGQTDLLATFVALGMVHPGFKAELAEMDGPKNMVEYERSVDGTLKWLANSSINYLTQSAIAMKKSGKKMDTQLLALENALSTYQVERRHTADRIAMKPQEVLDQKLSALLDRVSKKAVAFLRSKQKPTDGVLKSGAFVSAELIAAMGSKESMEDVGNGLTYMLNELEPFKALQEFWTDLQGVTKSNAAVMDLVNKVKSHVDAMRQDYREKIPQILSEKFTRKITRDEWTQMFEGISQTDLTALGNKQALTLLKDLSQLPVKIKRAEALVAELASKNGSLYKKKANALANWMVNKEVTSTNLLRNAEAIANLYGEGVQPGSEVTPDLIEAIDDLTTLYALDKVSQETKDTLQELANTEEEGLKFIIGYQASTKGLELQRIADGEDGAVSRINGWKGYAPVTAASGNSIVVRDDVDFKEMVKLGYERVGDYEGDAQENYRGSRGYYQSTVGGKSAYRQGVAQTVHATFQGVDPRTGVSRTGEMAGFISGRKAELAKRVKKRVNNDLAPGNGETMVPVYGANGDITGYELTMDPKRREALQEDKHMARMLGAWSGRIVEETMSDRYNKTLVQTLKDQWDEASPEERRTQFTNVADPKHKDAVIRDAWDTMGFGIKDAARDVFNEADTLMVRKDLVNDALGFHQASVRDAFTGTSRWSPETQQALVTAATAVMGKNAYKYMVKTEDGLGDLVSYAKTTIVVRSMVVIWENLLSNNLHLLTWGVGPVELVKAQRAKFIEINQYVKNQERILELNAELAANVDNASKARRITAELRVLDDANQKLSIRPLLEAGEFSTVSESLTEADQAIREGKLSDFFEKAADKLPGGVQTAFKNFAITKDTALFQGLNRAVQYGDFVSKAVLYDHLTKVKGKTEAEAMDVIKEEFVNYNRLSGRDRDYLESTGMLWFMNYKIRIMKIMARMVRERPASALFYAGGVGPMADIDTVISGSGLGAYLDNRLGYAIGPEMGYNGLFMNPWNSLVN
jgi:hypothetical protein